MYVKRKDEEVHQEESELYFFVYNKTLVLYIILWMSLMCLIWMC
jgi:hypothetical protein